MEKICLILKKNGDPLLVLTRRVEFRGALILFTLTFVGATGLDTALNSLYSRGENTRDALLGFGEEIFLTGDAFSADRTIRGVTVFFGRTGDTDLARARLATTLRRGVDGGVGFHRDDLEAGLAVGAGFGLDAGGGRGGGAGSGRPIAGTAAGEGCRASIRVHAHAQTRMAACCAPHQRPSVGTGSPGRTALPSIRACSGIEAMTCLATPRHRVVDRSRIAFSIKSFLETDPILAAYSAISFSRAKASGPARPYVW